MYTPLLNYINSLLMRLHIINISSSVLFIDVNITIMVILLFSFKVSIILLCQEKQTQVLQPGVEDLSQSNWSVPFLSWMSSCDNLVLPFFPASLSAPCSQRKFSIWAMQLQSMISLCFWMKCSIFLEFSSCLSNWQALLIFQGPTEFSPPLGTSSDTASPQLVLSCLPLVRNMVWDHLLYCLSVFSLLH